VGVATAAVGFFGRAAMAAEEEAADFGRAAGNFKGRFAVEDLERFTAGLENLTGIDAGKIVGGLGLLGTFQMDRSQAEALALPILNATEALKAQGVTAEQLAVQVGKAFQTGSPTALKRSGIIIDELGFKNADAAGRVKMLAEALQNQGGDAAKQFRDTLPGALMALGTATGNLQEAFGELSSGPARQVVELLISAAKGATDTVHAFNELPGPVKTGAFLLGVGLAGALGKYTLETWKAKLATNALVQSLGNLAAAHGAAAGAAGANTTATGLFAGKAGQTAALGGTAAMGGWVSKPGGTIVPGASKTPFLASFAGKAGLASLGAAIVGNLALGMLPDTGDAGFWKRTGQGALNYGAAGASIGSFFGPQGALIGGAGGALLGGTLGALSEQPRAGGAAPAAGPTVTRGEEQIVTLLKEQNGLLRELRGGNLPFGTDAIPGALQAQALMRAARLLGT
jgi:hypothetical protein